MRHRLSNRIVTRARARAAAMSTSGVEREHVAHAPLGRDVDLVGVAGEVGDEGERRGVLVQDAPTVALLRADDLFQHRPAGARPSAALTASSFAMVFNTKLVA